MPRPNVIHDPARQDARTSPREPTAAVRHLTQLDLARRWNMSTRTLERHRWLGIGVPYLKLGGRVAYRLEDVEAYEALRRHGAADDGRRGGRRDERPGAEPEVPAALARHAVRDSTARAASPSVRECHRAHRA